MFFRYIMVAFIILGIMGFLYGDRIFKFQADLMIGWMYDFPAYEAYERIIQYYPSSPYKQEALKMMEILTKRNADLRNYLNKRDSGSKKVMENRAKQDTFH
ncbi:MAG: hypothetical protein HQM09_04810 [Candidatus Riflebacteria bacterium]|nr:hypothetical protein [Candidatus Riflebacteria bacterium]